MKKSLMLGVWMMAATLVMAQPRSKDAHQHSGRNAEKMKTELSLDDEQYASIKKINEKYAGRHLMLRRDSTLERDQKLVEMKALRADRKKEVDAVLTPDQKTKWAAYREARAEKIKSRMSERQARHAGRMKEALSLTDEQQARMKAARETFKEKAEEARNNPNFSETEKRSEIKKLKSVHEETVKSILTEEQFKKWTEFKTKNPGKHRLKHR